MAFRSIEEFEAILRDTPLAVRYLDLAWCIATTHSDWMCIKYRMIGAAHAVPYHSAEHEDYMLLAEIADSRMADTLRIAPPAFVARRVSA